MRSGRFQISRGHQLREGLGSAPRLLIVPREDPKPRLAPVSVAELAPPPPAPPPAAPVSPEYYAVHDRLSALERLARLRDEGALTAREYSTEKAKLLRPPGDELVLRDSVADSTAPGLNGTDVHAAPSADSLTTDGAAAIDPVPWLLRPAQGPALLDRISVWKVMGLGLVAGLILSYLSQPRETVRFLEDLFRLFGG